MPIDSTPPTPQTPGVSPTHSTDGRILISWNSSDASSGLSSTTVYVDGVARSSSTNQSGVVVVSGLSDGTHNITVTSTDTAGNRGSSSSSVTVDTNLFSPGRPYGSTVLIGFVIALLALAVVLFLLRKRIR